MSCFAAAIWSYRSQWERKQLNCEVLHSCCIIFNECECRVWQSQSILYWGEWIIEGGITELCHCCRPPLLKMQLIIYISIELMGAQVKRHGI